MKGRLLQLLALLTVASEWNIPRGVAKAFSAVSHNAAPQRRASRGVVVSLFSTPPPLSSLSDKDDSSFDNYTTEEITNMKNVVVSLSEESNDEARRARLKLIMEVGLEGPNGGPKRFATLFERVLAQVGEQVQKEAREKYENRAAEEAPSEAAAEEEDETERAPDDDDDDDEAGGDPPEIKPPPEKSPEEKKLWALVDMMVQSKTMIKKHKF